MWKGVGASIVLLFFISGCSSNEASCSSETVASLLDDTVKNEVRTTLRALGKHPVGGVKVNKLDSEGVLSELPLNLKSVRTVQVEENINKKHCAASLSYAYSDELIKDARAGLRFQNILNLDFFYRQVKTFEEAALNAGLSVENSAVSQQISYTVQPTDDGEEIYLEYEQPKDLQGWLAKVVSSASYARESQRIREAQEKTASSSGLDSCVQEKVDAFRAEMGEEALIRHDMLGEWEGQCG